MVAVRHLSELVTTASCRSAPYNRGLPKLISQEAPVDTVMVRKIDDLGRVVIPAETRRLFNIHEGDELEIGVENGSIVLRKLQATCVFCGSTEDVGEFLGRGICSVCRGKVAA